MIDLQLLQKKLHYTFKDSSLLVRALTHRSREKLKNNERLEFLGDSVLGLVISTELFDRYAESQEGELSRVRAALVKGETIAKIALNLQIDQYIQLGTGESKGGGHQRESILAGAFEAIIGSIYLDGGFDVAQACVLRWYSDVIDRIEDLTDVKDAKTILQEWLQARKMDLPEYTCTTSGAAHRQVFDVCCHVKNLSLEAHGQSTSRRKAEQIAAKLLLEQINTAEL